MRNSIFTRAAQQLTVAEAAALLPRLEQHLAASKNTLLESIVITANYLPDAEQQRILTILQEQFTEPPVAGEKVEETIRKQAHIAFVMAASAATTPELASEIGMRLFDRLVADFGQFNRSQYTPTPPANVRLALEKLMSLMTPDDRIRLRQKMLATLDSVPKSEVVPPVAWLLAASAGGLDDEQALHEFLKIVIACSSPPTTAGIMQFITSRPVYQAENFTKILGTSILASTIRNQREDVEIVREVTSRISPEQAADVFTHLLDKLPTATRLDHSADGLLLTSTAERMATADQPSVAPRILKAITDPKPFNSELPLVECLASMPASLTQPQIDSLLRLQIKRINVPPVPPKLPGGSTLSFSKEKRIKQLAPLLTRLDEERRSNVIKLLIDALSSQAASGSDREAVVLAVTEMLAETHAEVSGEHFAKLCKACVAVFPEMHSTAQGKLRTAMTSLLNSQQQLQGGIWTGLLEQQKAAESNARIPNYRRRVGIALLAEISRYVPAEERAAAYRFLWKAYDKANKEEQLWVARSLRVLGSTLSPDESRALLPEVVERWSNEPDTEHRTVFWTCLKELLRPHAAEGVAKLKEQTNSLLPELSDTERWELLLLPLSDGPRAERPHAMELALASAPKIGGAAAYANVRQALAGVPIAERLQLVKRYARELQVDFEAEYGFTTELYASSATNIDMISVLEVLDEPMRVGVERSFGLSMLQIEIHRARKAESQIVWLFTHWIVPEMK